MYIHQIEIRIKDFRAIKEANIILDGITVVAGENGSGKSTLSKFLYYVFKTSNEYEELIDNRLKINLSDYYRFLEELQHLLVEEVEYENHKQKLDSREYRYSLREIIHKLESDDLLNQSKWIYVIDKLHSIIQFSKDNLDKNLFEDYNKPERYTRRRYLSSRIKLILKDISNSEEEISTFEEVFPLLKNKIQELFSNAEKYKLNRHSSLLKNELYKIFPREQNPNKYEIFEYDSLIISNESETLLKPHTIKQILYIDTPMSLGVQNTQIDHWNYVNKILSKDFQEYNMNHSEINEIITKGILGDTMLDKERKTLNGYFIYKREDGSEFNLLDCATGIRSFSILQILLRNGFLNKYTLLVIDEPESHLHPQWIIEYARLIVLLNKHVGVKFFLASHNPDMVSAIKYISEKEGIDNNLNFYLAERDKPAYTYSYTHLGTDIEPIFGSFNIALDRISEYGSTEELESEEE